MTGFALAHISLPAGARSADRVASVLVGDRLVLVLADGAGGTTFGREAADAVIDAVLHEIAHGVALDDPLRIADVLRSVDVRLTRERRGRTTAVCLSIGPDSIVGASAGDSEAWIVDERRITVLTAAQSRRPLLGDGAVAVPFRLDGPLSGSLVLASDGLFSYASESAILDACTSASAETVADALVTAAKPLQDDLALFVVRRRGLQ